jgi:hypothetical protein
MKCDIKRCILVFVVLFLCTTSGISQWHLGLRGGIYSTWIKSDNITVDGKNVEFTGDPKMGFHVGIVTEWRRSKVFIQPELLYCSIQNDISIHDKVSRKDELTALQIKKIDLPVMLGLKWRAFKFQAGPVGSVIISNKSDITDYISSDLLVNRATLGFQAGIGVDVSRLTLDLKYEGGLTTLDEGMKGLKQHIDARVNEVLVFSIGLFFSDR